MSGLFINTFIKFFFLLTPFFLLTTFLSMTRGMDVTQKKKIAVKVTLSMIVICIILFHIGNQIFAVFGITLDSFRIGTGILLILSAITLVQGPRGMQAPAEGEDISVVPLAIPVAVGPATIERCWSWAASSPASMKRRWGSAIVTALLCVGLILFLSGLIERIVKVRGSRFSARSPASSRGARGPDDHDRHCRLFGVSPF